MKNFIKLISMLLVFVLIATALVACGETTNGVDGLDGVDGINGTNGVDGKDGKDGKDGVDGKDGKDGANGKSAYELAVESGFDGTLEDWLESLKGETGAAGAAGAAGATGANGLNGIGIKGARVEFVEGGYKLIFTLDNGEELEVPVIAPTKVDTTVDTITPEGSDTPVEVAKLSEEMVVNDTSANGYSAKLPTDTLLEAGTTEVTLIIKEAEANANITVNADTTEKKALDIKVEGVSEHNDKPIIITLKGLLEKNLINITLHHGDDKMTKVASANDVDAHNEFYYNAATGDVTIATVSFSNFTYTYTKGVEVSANGKTYTVNSPAGLLWVEAQTDDFFSGKTVMLGNDIDFNGAEIKPIKFWNPENRIVFDGNNKTIKNFKITANANSGNQALFNGTVDIKNLTVENATVTGNGYTAIIGGNIYGSIDNCTVKNSVVTDKYWQAGIIAAQFNTGNITNCTVEGCTLNGGAAVGILAGITNETIGTRKFENNTIKNCTINQTHSFGESYDALFGVVTGYINIETSDIYFNNCTIESCTVKGEASTTLYGIAKSSDTIYVNNQQVYPVPEASV